MGDAQRLSHSASVMPDVMTYGCPDSEGTLPLPNSIMSLSGGLHSWYTHKLKPIS